MKRLLIGLTAFVLIGCLHDIDSKDVKTGVDYTKTTLAILCALQGATMNDSTINEVCNELLPRLNPQERKIVESHVSKNKVKNEDGGMP